MAPMLAFLLVAFVQLSVGSARQPTLSRFGAKVEESKTGTPASSNVGSAAGTPAEQLSSFGSAVPVLKTGHPTLSRFGAASTTSIMPLPGNLDETSVLNTLWLLKQYQPGSGKLSIKEEIMKMGRDLCKRNPSHPKCAIFEEKTDKDTPEPAATSPPAEETPTSPPAPVPEVAPQVPEAPPVPEVAPPVPEVAPQVPEAPQVGSPEVSRSPLQRSLFPWGRMAASESTELPRVEPYPGPFVRWGVGSPQGGFRKAKSAPKDDAVQAGDSLDVETSKKTPLTDDEERRAVAAAAAEIA